MNSNSLSISLIFLVYPHFVLLSLGLKQLCFKIKHRLPKMTLLLYCNSNINSKEYTENMKGK